MEQFVYFVLGSITSLLIGLATPRIEDWLKGRPLVRRSKLIKSLEEERALITELYSDSSKMSAALARDLTTLIIILAAIAIFLSTAIILQAFAYQIPNYGQFNFFGSVIVNAHEKLRLLSIFQNIAWVILALAYLLLVLLATMSFRALVTLRKVRYYDQYLKEVEARIEQLKPNRGSQQNPTV